MPFQDILVVLLSTLTLSSDPQSDPADAETTAPAETAALTCRIEQGDLRGAESYSAVLTAGSTPAAGAFEYALNRTAASAIRLNRTGSFMLKAGESTTLGIHAMAGGGITPELTVTVDGKPVDCPVTSGT